MSLIQVERGCDWPLILPYFDGSVPAGFPSPAEDYLETPLDLSEYLIENKAATFMMRVDGDSMKDAGILDGDLLVVDRAAKPVNGSVVIVAVNGEYTVKRLRRCPDCVWLEPANARKARLKRSAVKRPFCSEASICHVSGARRRLRGAFPKVPGTGTAKAALFV